MMTLPFPAWTLLRADYGLPFVMRCLLARGLLIKEVADEFWVLGGGLGMPGAIRLAAEAALRTGAGLVRVASRTEHQLLVLAGRPELMWGSLRSQQY